MYLCATNSSILLQVGHVCGDSIDLIDGFPTGCVRISFGYMSTLKDAQIFLQFIDSCFVEKDSDPVTKVLNTVKYKTADINYTMIRNICFVFTQCYMS